MRVASTFWALITTSRRRHFPAINWTSSYSLYNFRDWFEREVATDWNELSREAMALLQREVELLEIVQLVGPDALAEPERAVLAVARMLREDFSSNRRIAMWIATVRSKRLTGCSRRSWIFIITRSRAGSKIPLERDGSACRSRYCAHERISGGCRRKEIRAIMDRVQFSFADLGVA